MRPWLVLSQIIPQLPELPRGLIVLLIPQAPSQPLTAGNTLKPTNLISKRLFQDWDSPGILCIDEYKPKRASGYDLIDSDSQTSRILYLEKAYGLGRGIVKEHFATVKALGIKPWAIIFDMRSCFPKAAKTVFGKDIIIQHDYFHVMKTIHYHLNRAMAEYRKVLQAMEINTLDIWFARWIILKNIERWSEKERGIIANLMLRYKGTTIEDILILKQKIRNIFLLSKSQAEAYQKRDELTKENWQIKNQHFANIIKFLNTPYFKYMTTFLDHPEIPRSGNSENVIRTWRQMEKVRYGFKSDKGRIDHLKLYQVSKYLQNCPFHEKSQQPTTLQ